MLKANKRGYQTFSDGWGTAMDVVDRQLVKVKDPVVHFHEASVGERRFWDAQVYGVSITRAVRVPISASVDQGDVFEIDGQQYEVIQKDRKDDRRPESWLLSLRSAAIRYRRAEDGEDRS